MIRWWRLIAAIAMTVACVSGCGAAVDTGAVKTEGASLNLQPPRENLRDGGSLTTAITEVSPQWNTFHADATLYTLALWRWYNPVLAYFSPEGEYSPNPDFLTDVRTETVDQKTVVTYTLNPRAYFNDGTPIDYRAFVETWRTSRGVDDRYIASSTDGYNQIASITRGVDDRQAVVRFDGVYAWPDGLFNVVLHPKATAPRRLQQRLCETTTPGMGGAGAVHDRLVRRRQRHRGLRTKPPSGGGETGQARPPSLPADGVAGGAERLPERRDRRDRGGGGQGRPCASSR